jgi:hypothetical protein
MNYQNAASTTGSNNHTSEMSFDPNSSGAIGSVRGRNPPPQGRRLTRARGTTVSTHSVPPQLVSSRRVRQWKRVRRVPVGTTFSVFLWVPDDQLTEEELKLHSNQDGESNVTTDHGNGQTTMGAESMAMIVDESIPEPLTEVAPLSAEEEEATAAPACGEPFPPESSTERRVPISQEETVRIPIIHAVTTETPSVTVCDPTTAMEEWAIP